MRTTIRNAVVGAVALAVAGPAAAQQKLRVADSLPAGHFFAESATKFWMARVSELTQNAVTFDYFPAEQLGKAKDLLALTKSGVVDIGYVVPSYVSDKMPLSAVAELPGAFATSCEGTMAFYRLATSGALAKSEFQPNGVRLLFALVMPPYQIFTARTKIEGIKSIEGLKLRTAGGAMDATVRRFKGVPVRMAGPDVYESLSRGTLDGLLFPYASLISYDVAGLSKYGTTGENFGSIALTYAISEARWKRLAPAVQEAMAKTGEEATRRACASVTADVARDLATITGKGVAMAPLPDADRAEIDKAMNDIAGDWAADLDKRGKPGGEVLAAFRAAVAAGAQ
jgi:TRAP-type C4-dicarboxylate transport system substrate-binding protein